MSTALLSRREPPTERDSGLFFRAFDHCLESMAVVHRARILCANPAFARLFGYASHQELEGTPLAALLPPGHRCAEGPIRIESNSGPCGYPGCQFEGRRKDGSRTRMEST